MEDDGETWTDLSFDTIVSMNCWGFTPDIFAKLESGLCAFLDGIGQNPLKAEYYLPAAVNEQQLSGVCDVKVYPTTSVWQGVTYPEDKERVKESLRAMIEAGEYPTKLWG